MSFHYYCPYCGKGNNDIDDIYGEDNMYEMECPECLKLYWVSPVYSVSYKTFKMEIKKT